MLLVKTMVRPSKIAGMGLFADQDIQQGSIVWQYTPDTCMTLNAAQCGVFVDSFHKTEQHIIHYYLTYSYYESHLGQIILCLDNGRFVNHSSQPICGRSLNMPASTAWQYSVALRDIAKGEELTEDYRSYDTVAWLSELYVRYGICHDYEQSGLALQV